MFYDVGFGDSQRKGAKVWSKSLLISGGKDVIRRKVTDSSMIFWTLLHLYYVDITSTLVVTLGDIKTPTMHHAKTRKHAKTILFVEIFIYRYP
jgi:hypothetical protein